MDTNAKWTQIARLFRNGSKNQRQSGLTPGFVKAIKAIDNLDYLGQNRTFYREEMLTGNVMVEDVLKTFLFS
jgi:hypothetical protein